MMKIRFGSMRNSTKIASIIAPFYLHFQQIALVTTVCFFNCVSLPLYFYAVLIFNSLFISLKEKTKILVGYFMI